MKNAAAIVPVVLLTPIFVLVILLGITWYVLTGPQRWVAEQRAMQNIRGRIVFVYSRRRHWGDFIANNVLPLLPEPPFLSICVETKEGNATIREVYVLIERVLRRMRSHPQRPFLMAYEGDRPRRWRVVSLHKTLLSKKPHAKRAEATQLAIREILGPTLEQFRLQGYSFLSDSKV
ncbi:MAG TPA: hypothetical protein VJZ71_05080 [Phycisphaerae bacterium]|nr:hypothetical protein [Phycisphaerae bacterium]